MFTPEIVELPDPWPACRRRECGSTVALARIDAPYGAVVIACENGHHRGYRKAAEFRRRGRYAGLFSAAAVAPDAPHTARERALQPNERRCAEVLEDAERCALCGTPPAEHPYRPELDLRSDRAIWTWLQRWRPALYAQLCEAVAIAAQRERVTFGDWRSKIPARLREALVDALDDSMLHARHLVPLVRLARSVDALAPRELDFAHNRLLVAMCRACGTGRWRLRKSRADYLREYVLAVHGGDERLARADAAGWRMMESVATHAARAELASAERSA